MWTDATQKVIDDFRLNLQQWTTSFCPTCLRIHSYIRAHQMAECSHCKSQARLGKPSHFDAENDMDPGLVISDIYENTKL